VLRHHIGDILKHFQGEQIQVLAPLILLVENQINFCISSKGHNLEYLFDLLPLAEKQTLKNLLKNAGNMFLFYFSALHISAP
jgi:hypothetical protein